MKKQKRVTFVGFHEKYDVYEDEKYQLLNEEYDLVIDEVSPDYVVCGPFNYDFLKYKDAIRIFWTGEAVVPDYNLVDYSIDFEHLEFGDRHLRLPLGGLFLQEKIQRSKDEYHSLEGRKFCSFIYSNASAHQIRDEFYTRLSAYKHVDSGGRHLNNIGRPILDKFAFLTGYKFNIAFENALHSGYFTEKLIDALCANTVPIYWGNPLISKDINVNRIVNCHEYENMDEVIKTVIELDNDEELFKQKISEPWFLDSQNIDHMTELKLYLKYIFDQPLEHARRRGEGTWNSIYEQKHVGLLIELPDPIDKKETSISLLQNVKRRARNFLQRL